MGNLETVQHLVFETFQLRRVILRQPDKIYSKLLSELTAPEPSFVKVEHLILSSTEFSKRLILLANSVMYAGLLEIKNVRGALLRLGFTELRKLIVIESFRRLYQTFDGSLKTPASQIWTHALDAADRAEKLAKASVSLSPLSAEVFIAALFHDIGKLYALSCFSWLMRNLPESQLEALRLTNAEIYEVCSVNHGDFGADILHSWGFEKIYCTVCKYHHASKLVLAAELSAVERDIIWAVQMADRLSQPKIAECFLKKPLKISRADLEVSGVDLRKIPELLESLEDREEADDPSQSPEFSDSAPGAVIPTASAVPTLAEFQRPDLLDDDLDHLILRVADQVAIGTPTKK